MEKKMRDQSRFRLWFQAAWFVLTNSYLRGFTKGKIYTGSTKILCVPGLNCYSCPGAIGACPMGALQAVLGDASYRVSLYVFGLIAAMGVLFGRLICGWMCPFGLVQDLLYKIKVKNKKKNLPGHKYLKFLRYVILAVFPLLLVVLVLALKGEGHPWFCEWICPSGTLLGGVPLVLLNPGLREAAGFRFAWKLILLIAILALAVFTYRPFCKYLCPLGAIYGLCNPISSYRLVVDKDKCVSCGTCQRVCGMDIKTYETPNSPDCIRCGKCMAACPTGAIDSTWRITGRKLKDRFFINDEVGPAEAEPLENRSGMATLLGLLMIGGGLSCGIYGICVLYGVFWNYVMVDAYQQTNALYLPLEILWLIACVTVVVTGVYTLLHRSQPALLLKLREKVSVAVRFALIGLLVGLVGIILDFSTLAQSFGALACEWYVFTGIPLLMPMCTILKEKIEGRRTSSFGFAVLFVIGCALAASPWIVNALLS